MNPEPNKRVFDVTRPGQTPATATARPVIVGHGSTTPDQSMQQPSSTDPLIEPDQGQTSGALSPQKNIQPSDDHAGLTPEVTSVAAQEAKSQPKADEPSESTQTPEVVNHLVESKAYFLPIKSGPSKKGTWVLVVLSVIILAAGLVFYLSNR